MPDGSLWDSLDDVCGLDKRTNVLHAVTPAARRIDRTRPRSKRRRTVDSMCGRRVVLYCLTAVNAVGEPIGAVTLSWPPRITTMRADGRSKCPVCAGLSTQKRTTWAPDGVAPKPLRPLWARP